MKTPEVIIIGNPASKKKIEFVSALKGGDIRFTDTVLRPEEFDFIELICLGYGHVDLMFAYEEGRRSDGSLFLGRFNDGIV